ALNPDPSKPADKRQILFDVKVWEVNQDVLRGLAKSEFALHEFYKANGLIKQPHWISAAIGTAISELLAPPGGQRAAPAPLPLRAFAVTSEPVSMKLLGHDISAAFYMLTEPELVATAGREATLLSGGEAPIFVPRADDPNFVAGWQEFGVMMKFVSYLLDNGRIVLALDFENSERIAPNNARGDSSATLIDSQGFRLSAQMKLGERLLVAQQTAKQSVIRLVQIQPTLVTDESIAKSSTEKSPEPAAPPMPLARKDAVRQASGISEESNPKFTGERGGVSPPVEPERATNRGADAAPLAEPQKIRTRNVPTNANEFQQLRDEIRDLRKDVRELNQRLDREQAATPKDNDTAMPWIRLDQ
ncbi:MAG TPA: hypothetical protein VK137_05795, partial [Planctomycetaceae bacterium]|nr:hypothetical protein [Planctomycetaceae bacterium]